MSAKPPLDLPDPNQVLQALGDPTRRAIVTRLAHSPTSVSHLAQPLGITLTAVTQHVQILEAAGLVVTQKSGRVRVCQLGNLGFQALQLWLNAHRPVLARHIDGLAAYLTDDQNNPDT